MLTCIAHQKQSGEDSSSIDHDQKLSSNVTPTKQAVKSLSSQIKDMALKASGAYRHCTPFASHPAAHQQRIETSGGAKLDSAPSDKSRCSNWRMGNSSSMPGRKELEARLKGISSGEGTPVSASGRRVAPVVFVEENEPKEWVAQVESGILITFVSLPGGGNDLKQIRFRREMFNKWEAQRWWTENSDRVMELYNVQKLNRQALPRSDDDSRSSKMESVEDSPVTPPLGQESLPHGIDSTPKLSNITDTAKTETSSMDAWMRTSGNMSVSNASDMETEWVEEDEAGVYITIRQCPDGKRELRRVRFSREKFGEMHARVWWEENRARVHKQYL